jgi:hypothetical protein
LVPGHIGRQIVLGMMATLVVATASACGGANALTSSPAATPLSLPTSTPPPPPTETPTPVVAATHVSLTGNVSGDFENVQSQCAPLAPSPPPSVQVTGTLDGRSFSLNVFDPASEGWGLGGGQYVLLDEKPTQGPSTEVAWSTTSVVGIHQWDIHRGAAFDATLEPQQGAATGVVTVTGVIVC